MTPEQSRDLAAALRNLNRQVRVKTELLESVSKRNQRLAKRNAELRARVLKLERSRDQWKDRATERRSQINTLRSRTLWLKQSRDLWRHRATR